MNARMGRTAIGVLAGTLVSASLAFPMTPSRFTGSIAGIVSSSAGVPQMGASVLLYNRFDRLIERVLTDEGGAFRFEALAPEIYAVRVSLASFLPAFKRNIEVAPGMQSLLNVNLASVFSSIELVAVSPGQSSVMSDEWRWVLRSSSATRPVLRMLPGWRDSSSERKAASLFSGTRGMVRVSAGEQGSESSLGSEPDLGTAFALATSFLGQNQLQVSGNVGYSSVTGAPTTAFRTSFRRSPHGGISSPEVKLTLRQLFLPARAGAALWSGIGDSESVPMLRTLSVTMLDQKQLAGDLRLEYGFSLDSVTFLDRMNYASPYGRLTYDRGHGSVLQFGYASGTPPIEAFMGDGETGVELQQDLSALAMFPRVSLRANSARIQRTTSLEAGYRKQAGSRTFSAAAYSDDVTNAALTLLSPQGVTPSADLLPDLMTNGWALNAGQYHGLGYMLSVAQELGGHYEVAVAYGGGPALTVDRQTSAGTGTPDELRSLIEASHRQSVTVRASGTVPASGTQYVVSYQWANVLSLNPSHLYLTQRMREDPGLNIRVRQPIPYFGGLPGHMEATAELRNLLGQGYAPLTVDGRRMYLVQCPRSVRGGLSFIF
jgi:hypothetical protein